MLRLDEFPRLAPPVRAFSRPRVYDTKVTWGLSQNLGFRIFVGNFVEFWPFRRSFRQSLSVNVTAGTSPNLAPTATLILGNRSWTGVSAFIPLRHPGPAINSNELAARQKIIRLF